MKYVLDSSVAFKWVVRESGTDQALELRDAYRGGVHALIAPDILPIELAHALTRAERQGRLNLSEATRLLTAVLLTSPDLHPYLPLLPRAVELSSQLRVGVYDCLYVALAEREDCEFVTADIRLIAVLQRRFEFIVELSQLA